MAGTMGTDQEGQMKHFQRRGNAVKNRNRTENGQGRTRAEEEHPKNEERNQRGSQADDASRRIPSRRCKNERERLAKESKIDAAQHRDTVLIDKVTQNLNDTE